jgi:hypothetical protein
VATKGVKAEILKVWQTKELGKIGSLLAETTDKKGERRAGLLFVPLDKLVAEIFVAARWRRMPGLIIDLYLLLRS